MLKRNNFVKFIFSLLLLLSIFAFSFSVSNNLVEASTVESKYHDDMYEYIYFTPLNDIEVGEISITFEAFENDVIIDMEWDSLNDLDLSSKSYDIVNEGDTLRVTNPIEYLADTEYCIKISNENYYGISDVGGNWEFLCITHCYFNYFRFTSDFENTFLYYECVEADFLECLITDDYYCVSIKSEFFSNCSFEKVYLPLNLETIYSPFLYCEDLTDIYFRSLPYYFEGVAYGCYKLENYWLTDSEGEFYSTKIIVDDDLLLSMIGGLIPSYVVSINPFCFTSLEVDALIIPSNVSIIYEEAFNGVIIGDLIFTSEVPPRVGGYQNYEELERIIVPYNSYETYITKDFFSDFSSIVVKSENVNPETPLEPEQPTHEHTLCPECGKCSVANCDGKEEDKCQGHTSVEPEQPFWSISLITSIISILVGGISSLSYGIGSGLTDLLSSIFISSNGGLSLFGGVVIVFAGLSLAIGLCRWIISFITSLGGDD